LGQLWASRGLGDHLSDGFVGEEAAEHEGAGGIELTAALGDTGRIVEWVSGGVEMLMHDEISGGFQIGICFPLSQVSALALEVSSQWDDGIRAISGSSHAGYGAIHTNARLFASLRNCHKNCHTTHGHGGNQRVT